MLDVWDANISRKFIGTIVGSGVVLVRTERRDIGVCYLEDLLSDRGVAVRHFARLLGFKSYGPVYNYIRCKNVKPENREKIERGIHALEIYDAVCPSLEYGRTFESGVNRTWGDLNHNYFKYVVDTAEWDAGFLEVLENL